MYNSTALSVWNLVMRVIAASTGSWLDGPLGGYVLPVPDEDLVVGANSMISFNLFLPVSAALNGVATLLIASKFWIHRLTVRFGRQKRSYVENVLIVFAESGVVYGALQVVNVILLYCAHPDSAATSATGSIYFALTANYPLIITSLIRTKHTIVETFGFSGILDKMSISQDPEQPPISDVQQSNEQVTADGPVIMK
ncbi:hypothetical protein DXG01_006212 [Tephrocybe rancida]|nr:hypothetical protein DXG01_006212 [Tephrocybe rancida]